MGQEVYNLLYNSREMLFKLCPIKKLLLESISVLKSFFIFQFTKRKLSVTNNNADCAPLKDAQWKKIVPRSPNPKVIYSVGFVCSRPFEWYKNHQNRTSETYLKLIRICLIVLVKVKCQGHFFAIFCVWSHRFLTFPWNCQSPVVI